MAGADTGGARCPWSSIAVGVLAAAFGVLALVVGVRWPPLLALDRTVVAEVNDVVAGSGALRDVLTAITHLGDTATVLGLGVIAAGWLLVRRHPRQAVAVVVTGLGSVVLYRVAKALFDRRRPDVETPVYDASGFSFPSGHATGSFAVYGVLLLALGLTLRRAARRWLTVILALVVFAIGVTRVALGVHYLTDVVGGWLLGALWLTVTAPLGGRWSRRGATTERGRGDLRPQRPQAHLTLTACASRGRRAAGPLRRP